MAYIVPDTLNCTVFKTINTITSNFSQVLVLHYSFCNDKSLSMG